MSAEEVWSLYSDIADTSLNIHDGVQGEHNLKARAEGYVRKLFRFNKSNSPLRNGSVVVEIGGGHGWLMREVANLARILGVDIQKIVDLDISKSMISMCKSINSHYGSLFDYELYDGITFPFENESVSCFYSAAAVQHIPKHKAYNIFLECYRTLKMGGVLTFHVLSTSHIAFQEKLTTKWIDEVKNQVSDGPGHWHHFYTRKELEDVLRATGFSSVSVVADGTAYCVVCKKEGQSQETLICDVCSSSKCVMEFPGEPDFYRCLSCGSDTAVFHDFSYTPEYMSNVVDDHDDEYMIKEHSVNVELMKKHATRNGTVLDVGSFRGYGMEALRRAGFLPYGFDVVHYSGSEKDVAVGDEISHSLWTIKFDAIMCREVIEHVQNWKGALVEMNLSLNDGGVLMLQTPVPTKLRHPIPHQSGHLRVFSHAALKKYVEACGFEIADTMLWDIGQIIVARKRSY